MNVRLLLCGLGIWTGATVALRLAGQHLLHPDNLAGTLILFAVSFPLMAWMVRRLCSRFQARPEEWSAGAVSVAPPTLLLDPFSRAFFPLVFANIAPEMAACLADGCCGAAQAPWWV